MVVEFTIMHLEGGPHFSDKVAEIIDIVKASKIPHKLTAMGTILEGDWNEIMALIKKCHLAARKKSIRVYTSIRIDDFHGREGRLEGKVKSVMRKVKK